MELKDLIGLHTLTGVSTETKALPHYYLDDEMYDASVISFILDGHTYTAVEDANDGYRSSMESLIVNKFDCSNTFDPINVFGVYKTEGRNYNSCDILSLYGMDGKLILEVGTDNSDDYYPSFVSNFNPENINI